MALPTLNATFASAADLPRRQMLARWLVGELGSGSVADYWLLPERYLWAKIAVAAGAPLPEANYISLPKQYVWKAIYDAVSGSSLGTIDWVEKQALGHIAAAYRGDTGNPANLATYIDWPWRYQVASIIGGIGPAFPSNGLLAFWKLDNLTDASGNGNSLTNNNNVQFVSGKIGNAAEFDGTNYFNTTTQIGQSFSLSFWLYPTEVSGYTNVLTWRVSGTGSIGYDGSVYWYNDNGGFLVQSSAGIITTNQWHHVVLVCDNNAITIYLDNSSVATGTDNNTRLATDLVIGAYLNGTETIVGKLDAVGIWDRAITNEERSILYNNGEGVEL